MSDRLTTSTKKHSLIKGLAGIVIAVVLFYITPGEVSPKAPWVAAMVGFMAVWWVFEVVPIPVTSLLPLVLMPLFGISDVATVGANYGRPIIFLFLGGFLLALGLRQSGVHKRIALHIIRLIGSRPSSLVLGFMVASGGLSMWISNTASVMVLLPIALSVLEATNEQGDRPPATLGVCLMLGIAYGADIGGMSTIIGTPPNLVFIEMYSQIFPAAPEIGFLQWMSMGIPLTLVFMALGWLLLTRFIFRMPAEELFEGKTLIRHEIEKLGPVRRDEVVAATVFAAAAILWMTGSDLNLGSGLRISGWRSLLGLDLVNDAAVAVAAASILFLVPSGDRPGERLLGWQMTVSLPWGILMLFGAGFAIATGFEVSGLSDIIGSQFGQLEVYSPYLVVVIVCTLLTFLTELTSNTAMTNLVLPILAKASVALGFDPRILMIPATLSASCAFMMPIASPTQAIVFGSGYVNIRQMMRAGIWFNLLGIILLTLTFVLLGETVYGVQWDVIPEWGVESNADNG